MEHTLEYIKKNMKPSRLYLHSQSYASGFYEKFGFKVCSEEFIEEQIPHVEMELLLNRKEEM